MSGEIDIWEKETPLRLRQRWESVPGISFSNKPPGTSVLIEEAMEILGITSQSQAYKKLSELTSSTIIIGGHVRKCWYREDIKKLKKGKKTRKKQKMQKKACLACSNRV